MPQAGRPRTPDRRVLNEEGVWVTRVKVQRACNGCGRKLGDVREAEIQAAVEGLPLPDVREECGCG